MVFFCHCVISALVLQLCNTPNMGDEFLKNNTGVVACMIKKLEFEMQGDWLLG